MFLVTAIIKPTDITHALKLKFKMNARFNNYIIMVNKPLPTFKGNGRREVR